VKLKKKPLNTIAHHGLNSSPFMGKDLKGCGKSEPDWQLSRKKRENYCKFAE
jgi:hypothetical protein